MPTRPRGRERRAPVREYVKKRWPALLISALWSNEKTRRFLKLADGDLGWAETYVGVEPPFDVAAVAKVLRELDRRAEDSWKINTWRTQLRRWFKPGSDGSRKAVEPDGVRRVLAALGADWLLGLYRVGYHRHALAMIYRLHANGAISTACDYMRATFGSDSVADRKLRSARVTYRDAGDPRVRALLLDRAAFALWPSSDLRDTQAGNRDAQSPLDIRDRDAIIRELNAYERDDADFFQRSPGAIDIPVTPKMPNMASAGSGLASLWLIFEGLHRGSEVVFTFRDSSSSKDGVKVTGNVDSSGVRLLEKLLLDEARAIANHADSWVSTVERPDTSKGKVAQIAAR